jgi:hypothetical protein
LSIIDGLGRDYPLPDPPLFYFIEIRAAAQIADLLHSQNKKQNKK